MSNVWFTPHEVFQEIQQAHPGATSIVNFTANVTRPSVLTVLEDGKAIQYCIDANILNRHSIARCE